MKVQPRVFSLEEANSLIPELDSRLVLIAHKMETYARRHDELFLEELLHQVERQTGLDAAAQGHLGLDDDFRALEADLEAMTKDLDIFRDLGCILRDVEHGFVDFMGQWDGELVYFCWRRGEPAIGFYRRFEDSADRRIPLRQAQA